jgi:hypothetical protein
VPRLRRRSRWLKWAGLLAALGLAVTWILSWEQGWSFSGRGNTTPLGPWNSERVWSLTSRAGRIKIGLLSRCIACSIAPVWVSAPPVGLHSEKEGWLVSTAWLPPDEALLQPLVIATDVPRGGWTVLLPLWIPFLFFALPTAFLFWRDHRPLPPHCCQRCGYDLTGNTSGTCPECGVRREDRQGVVDERAIR